MLLNATTIFADGDPCPPTLRKRLAKGRFTIALDGAAERARKEGWVPHLIAGDFDKVSKATLRYFERKGVAILPTPDQQYTDLEKAIAWCVLRDAESIWIAQAMGGRLDHAFSALSFLKRFHSRERELVLFQQNESVRFAKEETLLLDGKPGRSMAVLPFPKCLVRSSGLKFELRDLALSIGLRESVANQARKKRVRLLIGGEALVVEGF